MAHGVQTRLYFDTLFSRFVCIMAIVEGIWAVFLLGIQARPRKGALYRQISRAENKILIVTRSLSYVCDFFVDTVKDALTVCVKFYQNYQPFAAGS